MNRREFLSYSFPATGAVMFVPGLTKVQLMYEINKQFIDNETFDEYDLVINDAGLFGYFAAIEAAKKN